MVSQPIILFIKSAYAGTGSAQDSGLLFLSVILFFTFILMLIFIYEQIRKLIERLLNHNNPDIDNNHPVSGFTDAF